MRERGEEEAGALVIRVFRPRLHFSPAREAQTGLRALEGKAEPESVDLGADRANQIGGVLLSDGSRMPADLPFSLMRSSLLQV
jgi:hypothetical protein